MSLHPTRTEHAQIRISIPGTDDTTNSDYEFTIEYNGVVLELQAILTLLGHDLTNALRDIQERLAL